MMYHSQHNTLGFLRLLAPLKIQKEVQTKSCNLFSYLSIDLTKDTDYESKGRAFESLRVRHSQPVSERQKNWFVPLLRICTPFSDKIRLLTCAMTCYNVLIMTLMELRERLHDLCQDAGSVRAWADKNKISFGYVSAVIRGDTKPGGKILKAMGIRKSFSLNKTTVMKFEDITN